MLVKLNSFVSSHPSFRELNQNNLIFWITDFKVVLSFHPPRCPYSIGSFMHRFSRILKSHREHLYILLSHPYNSHTHTLYSQVRERACTHTYSYLHTQHSLSLSLSHTHTHSHKLSILLLKYCCRASKVKGKWRKRGFHFYLLLKFEKCVLAKDVQTKSF